MIDPFASAIELAAAIKSREVSAMELTDLYIDRVERYDGRINAVVVHDFERGREAARAADRALARGAHLGPLHGVPMTVKEAYNIQGLPTTWGIPELRDNIASEDADYVRRLKGAGAVIFGKTNVPINLGDFQSFNEIYGTTNNPWDLTRTPGGSSGGSSAALAAGLTALEAGSDIGGSIRNPAHYCGIYGHKPTWGIVSDAGHALPGQFAPADIAVVGPMARCAEDLALSLDIVAGAGRTDRGGWKLDLPRPAKSRLRDFRVAILPNHDRAPVAAELADRVQQVGEMLARLGATVSDSAFPEIDIEKAFEAYLSLLWGVMAAGLSEEEKEGLRQARALSAAGDEVPASLARFGVQEHGEWLRFDNRRFRLRKAWQGLFPGLGHAHLPTGGNRCVSARPWRLPRKAARGRQRIPELFPAALLVRDHHRRAPAEHRFPHRVVKRRPAHRPAGCRRGVRRLHDNRVCTPDGAGTRRICGTTGFPVVGEFPANPTVRR